MGGNPCWFLAVLLLPEHHTDRQLVEVIFQDVVSACQELSITLCGGHTEVTTGIDRPILVGHMLGEAKKGKLPRKSRLEVEDMLLLTKGIAIEGTAILTKKMDEELKKSFSPSFLN